MNQSNSGIFLECYNFKKFGHRFFNLPLSGVVLFQGPSGIGKTSVCDALSFALYNTDKNDAVPHDAKANQRIYVKCTFRWTTGQSLEIYRQKRSELLTVIGLGLSLQNEGAQGYLNTIFGSPNIWDVGGYIHQGQQNSFFYLSGAEKSNLMQELIDTNDYNVYLQRCKEKLTSENQSYQQIAARTQLYLQETTRKWQTMLPQEQQTTPWTPEQKLTFLQSKGAASSAAAEVSLAQLNQMIHSIYQEKISTVDQQLQQQYQLQQRVQLLQQQQNQLQQNITAKTTTLASLPIIDNVVLSQIEQDIAMYQQRLVYLTQDERYRQLFQQLAMQEKKYEDLKANTTKPMATLADVSNWKNILAEPDEATCQQKIQELDLLEQQAQQQEQRQQEIRQEQQSLTTKITQAQQALQTRQRVTTELQRAEQETQRIRQQLTQLPQEDELRHYIKTSAGDHDKVSWLQGKIQEQQTILHTIELNKKSLSCPKCQAKLKFQGQSLEECQYDHAMAAQDENSVREALSKYQSFLGLLQRKGLLVQQLQQALGPAEGEGSAAGLADYDLEYIDMEIGNTKTAISQIEPLLGQWQQRKSLEQQLQFSETRLKATQEQMQQLPPEPDDTQEQMKQDRENLSKLQQELSSIRPINTTNIFGQKDYYTKVLSRRQSLPPFATITWCREEEQRHSDWQTLQSLEQTVNSLRQGLPAAPEIKDDKDASLSSAECQQRITQLSADLSQKRQQQQQRQVAEAGLKQYEEQLSAIIVPVIDNALTQQLQQDRQRLEQERQQSLQDLSSQQKLEEYTALYHQWSQESQRQEEVTERMKLFNKIKTDLVATEHVLMDHVLDSLNVMVESIINDLFPHGDLSVVIRSLTQNKTGNANLRAEIGVDIEHNGHAISSIKKLSGGEQSRVSLALTLAFSTLGRFPFCILDESLSGLDEEAKENTIAVIRAYAKDKLIISVLHETIEGLYDYVYTLSKDSYTIKQ